jgi:hypothetical protein
VSALAGLDGAFILLALGLIGLGVIAGVLLAWEIWIYRITAQGDDEGSGPIRIMGEDYYVRRGQPPRERRTTTQNGWWM